MNIFKFKLLNHGYSGVIVSAIESIYFNQMVANDTVVRERRIAISKELRDKIQSMKYFYLNLTSHWIPPYQKYINVHTYMPLDIDPEMKEIPSGQRYLLDIWNHTEITGIQTTTGGFSISGTIEVVEGKKISIRTPIITEEDDVSFYIDAIQRIQSIMGEMGLLLTRLILPANADKETIKALDRKMKDEDINDLDKDQLAKMMVDKMIDIGVIGLISENDYKALNKDNDEPQYDVYQNTGNIDSANMPEPEIEKNKEEEETMDETENEPIKIINEKEKSKNVLKVPKESTLSSSKNFPDLSGDTPVMKNHELEEDIPEGGTLEHLEFSENMGETFIEGIDPDPDDVYPEEEQNIISD